MNTKNLVMRTCDKDFRSYGGFRWPRTVGETVVATDWDPSNKCGGGLHGLLLGTGEGALLSREKNAVWMIVEAVGDIVDLGGKVKFRSCIIRHIGDRVTCVGFLAEHGIVSSVAYGTASAGNGGTASAGDHGTASAGNYGTASAGYGGTASAGDYGTASAGYGGAASAGNGGTASAGDGGTASAGEAGVLVGCWHDGKRKRVTIAYVGEKGIEPRKKYEITDHGEFAPVE